MYTENEGTAADWLKETRKGYLRIAVLTLLSRKPRYGYEIMKEIKERTGGFWRPTAGGIYPILQSLEESAYIEGEWDTRRRRRKTYRITETGRSTLQQALTRQNQIAGNISNLFREYMKDVLDVKSAARPPVPNLFSAFLEEGKEGPFEDSVNVLRRKRDQIESAIKRLQNELDVIDKRLAKVEQRKKRIPPGRLT